MNIQSPAVLAILYSSGGLGDVGRHAVRAALERKDVASIKVLTQHPKTLQEKRWNCGCPQDHKFTKEEQDRLEIIPIRDWKDDDVVSKHLANVTAVVSCLGTRQPFLGDRPAFAGSKAVVDAMKVHGIFRVVAMSSIGILEDSPSMEWHFGGKVMDCLFSTLCRREYNDLARAEQVYRDSEHDYLLIRPVGLGEDVEPRNEWFLQKEKFKDVVGTNIAKLDCARYMVQEALAPTQHRKAVVIGSDPEKDDQLVGSVERK